MNTTQSIVSSPSLLDAQFSKLKPPKRNRSAFIYYTLDTRKKLQAQASESLNSNVERGVGLKRGWKIDVACICTPPPTVEQLNC